MGARGGGGSGGGSGVGVGFPLGQSRDFNTAWIVLAQRSLQPGRSHDGGGEDYLFSTNKIV